MTHIELLNFERTLQFFLQQEFKVGILIDQNF